MSNIPAQFDMSSPEGVVAAPKGAKFFRDGDNFFLSVHGQTKRLLVNKKAFLMDYYNEPWFPTLKDSIISFSKPYESWVKTGKGTNKNGWVFLGSVSSFVNIVAQRVPIFGDITQVAAGYYQSYFLKTDGNLYAAGYNDDGELGIGFTSYRETASFSLANVKKVAASCEGFFATALKNDGTLWFTGYGGYGQFGNGTNDTYNTWTQTELTGDITGSGAITDIAVGEEYTVLLMADGTLWGTGDEFNINTNTFIHITGSVKAIAGGGYHLLYINNSDVLFGIGSNWDLQLGDGGNIPFYNWDSPYQIDTGVKAVGAGGYHSGYIKNDDTLWMMGANWDGQIGISSDVTEYIDSPIQVDTNVKSITGGDSHTLYIKNDNTLWGMGYNGDGELGTYPWDDIYPAKQIDADVESVCGGNEHSLYVKTNKTAYGMGYNYYYQMGSTVYPFGMFSTNALSGWTADGVTKFNYYDDYTLDENRWNGSTYGGGKFILGGGGGSTQIRYSTDGKIWNTGSIYNVESGISGVAYGSGKYVAVSNVSDNYNDGRPETFTSTDGINWTTGSLNNTNWQELVSLIYANSQFVAGGDRRIVTSPDGDTWTEQSTPLNNYIRCLTYGDGKYVAGTWWGDYSNAYEWYSYSQSFNNQTVDSFSAGANYSLILKNGTLYGAGANADGQLGFGGNGGFGTYFKFLPITTNVKNAAGHQGHTTFVKNDGTLWVMGYNGSGQLGNGTFNNAYSPIQIDSNVSESFGGSYTQTTLYIKNDKTLWGAGYNYYGQLGNNPTYVSHSAQLDTDVVSAAGGEQYIMYIKSDGTLYTMGSNNWGQLGNGTNTDSNTPVSVDTSVKFCAAGGNTAYYIKNNGKLYGMGYNGWGQLGQGDTSARNMPTLIDSNVVSVSANNDSVVYVKDDGTTYGIGYNANGRLGTGNSTAHNTPATSSITGSKQAYIGYDSSFIVKTDNTLWVVGYGGYGSLGLVIKGQRGVYSTDGVNWSSSYMPQDWNNGIAYGNGIFVATGDDQTIITSPNGIDWDYNYISTTSYFSPSGVIFDGTKFVVFSDAADNQLDIATSTDGINWTLGSTGTNNYWNTMVYGDGKYSIFANGWNEYVNPPHKLTIENAIVPTPSPTPSQTPAASVTPTPTPTPEATPTPTPGVTPTPTPSVSGP